MSWVVDYFHWTVYLWNSSGGPFVYGIVPGIVVLIAAVVGLYLHYDGVKDGGNFFKRVGCDNGEEIPVSLMIVLGVFGVALATSITWMYWLPLVVVLAVFGGAGYGIVSLVTSAGKRAKVAEDEKKNAIRQTELLALRLNLDAYADPKDADELLLETVQEWDAKKQSLYGVKDICSDSHMWGYRDYKSNALKKLKKQLELV